MTRRWAAICGVAALLASGAIGSAQAADVSINVSAAGQEMVCRQIALTVTSGQLKYLSNYTSHSDGSTHRVENVSSVAPLTLSSTVVAGGVVLPGTIYTVSLRRNVVIDYAGGMMTGSVKYDYDFRAADGAQLGTYSGKWDLTRGDLRWADMKGTCNP